MSKCLRRRTHRIPLQVISSITQPNEGFEGSANQNLQKLHPLEAMALLTDWAINSLPKGVA